MENYEYGVIIKMNQEEIQKVLNDENFILYAATNYLPKQFHYLKSILIAYGNSEAIERIEALRDRAIDNVLTNAEALSTKTLDEIKDLIIERVFHNLTFNISLELNTIMKLYRDSTAYQEHIGEDAKLFKIFKTLLMVSTKKEAIELYENFVHKFISTDTDYREVRNKFSAISCDALRFTAQMLAESINFDQSNAKLNGEPFAFFTHTHVIRSNEEFMMSPDEFIEYWKEKQKQELCLCYTTNMNTNVFKKGKYFVIFIFDKLNPENITHISPVNSCSNQLLVDRSQTLYSPVTFAKLTREIGEEKGYDNFNEILYETKDGETLMPKGILCQTDEPTEIDIHFSGIFGIPIIYQSKTAYFNADGELPVTGFEPNFFI